jgi:hypothetical protein
MQPLNGIWQAASLDYDCGHQASYRDRRGRFFTHAWSTKYAPSRQSFGWSRRGIALWQGEA